MNATQVWQTGYPPLPDGYEFQIEVVIDGTKVRLQLVRVLSKLANIKVMESFVPAQYHEPENEYLTKVWNAMNGMSLKIKDRLEREAWIKEHFG